MSKVLSAIALMIITGLAAAPSAGRQSGVEGELKQLEQRWMGAVRGQDIATIEKLLAPEYTLTVAIEGQPLEVVSRTDYVSACKGIYVIHSFEFKEFLIRVYGDIAIVSSRYVQKATVDGQDRSAEFFLSDTWVRKNRTGQVAARYSSRPEK